MKKNVSVIVTGIHLAYTEHKNISTQKDCNSVSEARFADCFLIQLLGEIGETIKERDTCDTVSTCKELDEGCNDDRAIVVGCDGSFRIGGRE